MARPAVKADPLTTRLRALRRELMLIPGLSGRETGVRRRPAAELSRSGISTHSHRLGNPIAIIAGDDRRSGRLKESLSCHR